MSRGTHPGTVRPWLRRLCFKLGFLLVSLPFVLFFLSNLWLALPPGRNWLAGKITSHCGLEARLERASWSPWDGIRLYGLALEQPQPLRTALREPLFTVTSIRIWPVWKALLRKRLEVKSIDLDAPRAVVPLELLARLSGPPPAVPSAQPTVAAAPPAAPAPVQAPPVAAAAPNAVVLPPPQASLESQLPTPPAPAAVHDPGAWIHVRHGSLSVVATGQARALVDADGFDADLPVAGDPASSSAGLSSLRGLGQELAANVGIPLQWQPPFVQIGPVTGESAGIPWRIFARLALAPGLPTGIEFNVPLTEKVQVVLPGHRTFAAGALRASGRFAGLLTTPSGWQGEFVWEGRELSATVSPQSTWTFDQGVAVLMLRGGLLSCTDARLIGDDLSLLGNATVLADSRTAAVLRVVSTQDIARGIAGKVGRLTGKRMAFGTLGVPDRAASDLYLLGNLDGINLQLGQGGDVIDGHALLSLLKAGTAPSP